ncbi:hypothetical protein [Nonomuraea sp. NPDC005501]|uniref:hypothetical protein n=1 Tax=Nonomuraea sp. NPDC005501 TaxID=3156884 RepID=UPI0033AFC66B
MWSGILLPDEEWSLIDPRLLLGERGCSAGSSCSSTSSSPSSAQPVTGLEVIGNLRPFGEPVGADVVSRFYDSTGNTLDYVYELSGDKLTIWGGAKGSPAYYEGVFSADGATVDGAWVYPGGGGYPSTMTRI